MTPTAGLSDRTRAQLFWFSRKEGSNEEVCRARSLFRDGQSDREIMPLAECR